MPVKFALPALSIMLVLGFALGQPLCLARTLQGLPLASAVKDDFFTFFHLKEKEQEQRNNGLVSHYFQPPSRDDVMVEAVVDKQGTIGQMSLIVGRKFIDDPQTNVFARDLVKSFIDAATPAADIAQTAGLVNEIFLRNQKLTPSKVETVTYNGQEQKLPEGGGLLKVGKGDLRKNDVALIMGGPVPKIPEQVSDAYRAFQGDMENYEQKFSTSRLIMKNHSAPKGRFLEVRIDVQGYELRPILEVVPAPSGTSGADQKGK